MTVAILTVVVAQFAIFSFSQPLQGVAETVSNVFVTNPASDPIPTSEKAKTRLYNFVDDPLQIKFDLGGITRVELSEGQPFISVVGFRQACIMAENDTGAEHANGITVLEGKLKVNGGRLVSAALDNAPLSQIHCFDIKAPHLEVLINGDPETEERVLLWLYLTA